MFSRLGGFFGASVYIGMASLYGYVLIRATHYPIPVRAMFVGAFVCLIVSAFIFITRHNDYLSAASTRVRIFVLVTTYTPLLANPYGEMILPEAGWAGAVLALLVAWCGLSLGKSYGWVPVNRGIVKRGPYRLVRHPMYAFYSLLMLTFICINYTPWNVVICLVSAVLGIIYSYLEEGVLSKDPAYQKYAQEVRYRFIPGVV